MTQREAYSIDAKVDDGMPATGKILSNYGHNCSNASNQTDFGATYRVNLDSRACWLNFNKIF